MCVHLWAPSSQKIGPHRPHPQRSPHLTLPPPCLFCLCPRPLFFLFSSEDNRLGDVIFLRHYCKAAARHMPLGSAEGEGCSAAASAHTTSAISWWRDGTECTQIERERERGILVFFSFPAEQVRLDLALIRAVVMLVSSQKWTAAHYYILFGIGHQAHVLLFHQIKRQPVYAFHLLTFKWNQMQQLRWFIWS